MASIMCKAVAEHLEAKISLALSNTRDMGTNLRNTRNITSGYFTLTKGYFRV